MTGLDEARDVLEEFRATPPSSTRRRVRLALRMKDIEEEYAERLIRGAERMVGHMTSNHKDPLPPADELVFWWDMNTIRKMCLHELDNLGLDKTQMAIAFATTIFDAEVITK